jgi:hypothetical protein
MKRMVSRSFLLLFFGIIVLSFANTVTEYQKALDYLDQRGEVYFRITSADAAVRSSLSAIISLDKTEGNAVYAYANKREFHKFLESNLSYEIVTPPGLQGPVPQMTDHIDMNNLQFDKYPTYDAYLTMMQGFQTKYPDKCKIYEIGTTVQGRKLILAKVSDNVSVKESEPEWFLNGGIHGDETGGIMICLRMIDYLCSSTAETDPYAKRILDSMEMWILPFMNPDGTYKGGNSTVSGAIRYNAGNIDLNRDYPLLPWNTGTWDYNKAQKETRVIYDFEKLHNFVGELDYHAGIETCVYPYSSVARLTPDNAWFVLSSRVYADTAQKYGKTGYFKSCKNGICNGYADIGYIALGTSKDYMYYLKHGRAVSLEVASEKLLPESGLSNLWDSNRKALLSYILEALNGIRGNVTDSLTGAGLGAKVFVEGLDKDSSWLYADASKGNYYRPIIEGTYDVTFSCLRYKPKTIKGIKATNYKSTIVNVQLCPEITGVSAQRINKGSISIVNLTGKGIAIGYSTAESIIEMSVFTVSGRLVKRLPLTQGNTGIVWNGLSENSRRVGSGCYLLRVQTPQKSFSLPFVISY